MKDRATRYSISILAFIFFLGIFGPHIAPFEPSTQHYVEGELQRYQPPSQKHLLGTNDVGQDVFSRVLVGARPTLITGFVGGTIIISLGITVGVTAGYMGGTVDSILMRFTDFVYALPVLAFAIVLFAFIPSGFWTAIFIISIILWRASARVLRAQVLQIKERAFIKSAKAMGASNRRIIAKHIFPNIASMAVLWFSFGIGLAIIFQANLAFLGFTDPFVPSWGVIIRNAYSSGRMTSAWWWTIPPGILISLTVLSTILIGRGYEQVAGQGEDLVA